MFAAARAVAATGGLLVVVLVLTFWLVWQRYSLVQQVKGLQKRLEHLGAGRAIDEEVLASVGVCPISRCVMVDPVVAGDGVTYERREFERFARGRRRLQSPVTRMVMSSDVVPNLAVRSVVQLLATTRAFNERFGRSERAEYWLTEGERCMESDVSAALQCFRRARDAAGPEDTSIRARATTRLAACCFRLERVDEGDALFAEAQAMGDSSAACERALALVAGLDEEAVGEAREASIAVAMVALALVESRAAEGDEHASEVRCMVLHRLERVFTKSKPATGAEQFAPLHLAKRLGTAAATGRVDEVRALLARGADANIVGAVHGATALHVAAEYNRLDVVNALLEEVADLQLNAIDSFGETALHKASRDDNAAGVLAALLARPECNVNAINHGGRAPLTCAAIEG